MARTLTNLALIDKDQGRLTEACARLEQALSLLTAEGPSDDRGDALYGLGLTLVLLNRFDEARERYEGAVACYHAAGDRRNEAQVLHALGELCSNNEAFEAASEFYKRSLELGRSIGAMELVAQNLSSAASILQACGNDLPAWQMHRKALRQQQEIGDCLGQVLTLNDLAILARERGYLSKAEGLLTTALHLAREMDDPHQTYDTALNRGDIRLMAGRPEQAAEDYVTAVSSSEALRINILLEQEALSYFGEARLEAYDRLVNLHANVLGSTAQALVWAERGKSQELLRRLRLSDSLRPRGTPDGLVARERNLLSELRRAARELAAGGTGALPALAAYRQAEGALRDLWSEMEPFDAEHVSWRLGEPLVWSDLAAVFRSTVEPSDCGKVEAVRRVVPVAFYVSQDAVLLFGMGNADREPELVKVPLDIVELHNFVSTNFGEHNRVREMALDLEERWHGYDYLVEPIAQWAAPGEVVCLVPHGLLHYLPLHALRVDGRYLIERNPVVYSPSISALRHCRARARTSQIASPAVGGASVFGDPTGDLPFARDEAMQVARQFDVAEHLGSSATKEAFVQALIESDVIHFAGHGRFDSQQPLRSGLRLADGDTLTAAELAGLEGVSARFVALSGCETGISETHPGDELIGLSRALFYAGASSLLVSLWRVPDASSAVFMTNFYQLLREHRMQGKADAVRQAASAIMARREWSSLYYWAPFVLSGDWS